MKKINLRNIGFMTPDTQTMSSMNGIRLMMRAVLKSTNKNVRFLMRIIGQGCFMSACMKFQYKIHLSHLEVFLYDKR